MSVPTPAIARRLAEAAELRAAGASWEATAQAVRRRVRVCRRWPELYPAQWSRLLAEARRCLRENAADEAVTTLRQLLRSEKENIRRDAAKALLAAAPDAPPPANDIDTHLVESDETELQQLNTSIDATDE